MRHLRFLAFLLVFCLLPVTLVRITLQTWLDDTREAQRAVFEERAETWLKDARDRILSGTTQLELAQAVFDEIEKRGEYVGGVVQEILARWDAEYPGVFEYQAYHVSVKRETLAWESVRGIPLANNIGHDVFVYEKLAEHLMRYRLWLERETAENALAPDLNPARVTMIQKKILGRHRSLAYVADRFRETIPVLREGRESILYWDFLYDNDPNSGQKTPMGLLILFIDPQAFRAQFQPERILQRSQAAAGQAGLQLGWYDPGDGGESGLSPDLRAIALQAGTVSTERYRDERELVSFLRLSTDRSGILYARLGAEHVHPDTDRQARILDLALALLIIAFVLIALPVQYGRFHLFFPLRYQVAALFLLAALPPVVALLYGGARYLRASRDLIAEAVQEKIRDRLREADEAARSSQSDLQQSALALLETSPLRRLAGDSSESALIPVQKLLDGRREAGEFHSWLLVDGLGRVRAESGGEDLPVLRPLAGRLAAQLLHYVNTGVEMAARAEPGEGELLRLLRVDKGRMRARILRRRGVIHSLHLFTRTLPLMIEPLQDSDGRATLALVLQFDLAARHQAVLERYLKERERNARRDGLRVWAWPRPPRRDLARERWFQTRPEARELVRRADREQATQTGQLQIDDRAQLACALPLQILEGWVLLGLTPLEQVEEEIERRRLYFAAGIVCTLLGALLASWGLTRRLIKPIRLVQQGVRAIAEGEYDYRMNLRSHDELGELSATFNRMVAGLQEKQRLSRYVSESVLDEVKKDAANEGNASYITATILFTDIRDFTGLTERHTPDMIVEMLNEYLGRMSRVIRENGGVVDKFIGDAVMAVFYPDHRPGARSAESRAVVAALQMRETMAQVNALRRNEGKFLVESGIGIHTGEVIRGSIGAPEHRVDLTVIGDPVNLAARLEAESRQGRHTRIYISERTWQAVRELVEAEAVELTRVKGKRQEVKIFEVVGLWRASEYLPWLSATDPDRRLQGLRLLAVIGDPVCLEAVRLALRDADAAVRREAALALASFPPDPIHAGLVAGCIDREEDPFTRASFVQVIGRIGDDRQRLALSRLFRDPDLRVQANAIEAIGAATDRRQVVEKLREFSRHPNNRIRANACVMLVRVGCLDGLDVLLAMTRQTEPPQRASGCWGLGEICSPMRMEELRSHHDDPDELLRPEFLARLDQCLDRLLELLQDENPMVVRNAARSIGRMGNRRAADALVRACQETRDADLRGVMLEALDEIGSFHVVRQLREKLRG